MKALRVAIDPAMPTENLPKQLDVFPEKIDLVLVWTAKLIVIIIHYH